MKLRFKVLRSWYLLSEDYELIKGNGKNWNYGIVFPKECYLPDGTNLTSILNNVKQEEVIIPEEIELAEDYYEFREYEGETEIDDLSCLTLFWTKSPEDDKLYFYDCVKYKDEFINLYLDED